jgi:hypothetical protein
MQMKTYTCAVCGKEHKSILKRSKCEEKCVLENEKAEAEKRREEHEAMRSKSQQDICNELEKLNSMVVKHLKEYNTFSFDKNYPYLNYIFRHAPWFF